jgi:hypothetical protein
MARKKAPVEVIETVERELFRNVRAILAKARATIYSAANTAMVEAYWNVGREIVEKQGGCESRQIRRWAHEIARRAPYCGIWRGFHRAKSTQHEAVLSYIPKTLRTA